MARMRRQRRVPNIKLDLMVGLRPPTAQFGVRWHRPTLKATRWQALNHV